MIIVNNSCLCRRQSLGSLFSSTQKFVAKKKNDTSIMADDQVRLKSGMESMQLGINTKESN